MVIGWKMLLILIIKIEIRMIYFEKLWFVFKIK